MPTECINSLSLKPLIDTALSRRSMAVRSAADALLLRHCGRAIRLRSCRVLLHLIHRTPESGARASALGRPADLWARARYEDLNERSLRHDPVLALLSDQLECEAPRRSAVLSGKSTLNRSMPRPALPDR